jgi:hypothetical protein
MLLDGRAVARSGSVPQYFLSSKRHSWLRRNAPILNVDVLLQRDKNSALTNAASPTGWEMPASANIRAVPGNGWLLCNQTEKEGRHENHLQCVDSFGGAVGMGPAICSSAGGAAAGKQGSSHQEGNKEARDARDEKDATAQDKKTKPSRDTSGLKDTSHHFV